MSDYHDDYPKEPIGGGNPYYRCKSCKLSAPEINGQLDRHEPWCEYWQSKQAAQPAPITSETGNQSAQGASAITSAPVLTDEEIVYLTDEIPLREGCFIKVARAIEQAVRSKLGVK